jgi:hypothetical protein
MRFRCEVDQLPRGTILHSCSGAAQVSGSAATVLASPDGAADPPYMDLEQAVAPARQRLASFLTTVSPPNKRSYMTKYYLALALREPKQTQESVATFEEALQQSNYVQ